MGKKQFDEWCKHLKIVIKCQDGVIPLTEQEVIYKLIYIDQVYIGKLQLPEKLIKNYSYQFQEINKLIANHLKKSGQAKTVRNILQKVNVRI